MFAPQVKAKLAEKLADLAAKEKVRLSLGFIQTLAGVAGVGETHTSADQPPI